MSTIVREGNGIEATTRKLVDGRCWGLFGCSFLHSFIPSLLSFFVSFSLSACLPLSLSVYLSFSHTEGRILLPSHRRLFLPGWEGVLIVVLGGSLCSFGRVPSSLLYAWSSFFPSAPCLPRDVLPVRVRASGNGRKNCVQSRLGDAARVQHKEGRKADGTRPDQQIKRSKGSGNLYGRNGKYKEIRARGLFLAWYPPEFPYDNSSETETTRKDGSVPMQGKGKREGGRILAWRTAAYKYA